MKRASSKASFDTNDHRTWTAKAVAFVRSIGIQVTVQDELAEGANPFLPKVLVNNGALMVSVDAFPGDVLHDAGHLACLPPTFRTLANGNLAGVFAAAKAYLQANAQGMGRYPEDPIGRALLQASDHEATAWQYCAAQAIGMPDQWLFPPGSYQDESAKVLTRLKTRSYAGINGLQASGFTVQRSSPYRTTPEFPKLAFWLHPGADLPDSLVRQDEVQRQAA